MWHLEDLYACRQLRFNRLSDRPSPPSRQNESPEARQHFEQLQEIGNSGIDITSGRRSDLGAYSADRDR